MPQELLSLFAEKVRWLEKPVALVKTKMSNNGVPRVLPPKVQSPGRRLKYERAQSAEEDKEEEGEIEVKRSPTTDKKGGENSETAA